MAAINDAPPLEGSASDIEKKATISGDCIERVDTDGNNDITLDKVGVDAQIDEFGARSKTSPEEIALVRKLDRTILVSAIRAQDRTHELGH